MEEGHWRCDLIGQTEEITGKPQIVRAIVQVWLSSTDIRMPTTTYANVCTLCKYSKVIYMSRPFRLIREHGKRGS